MTDIKLVKNIPSNQNDYTSLIKFSDVGIYTDGANTYAFFKITNLFCESILSIEINVKQFDKDHNLLTTTNAIYNDNVIKSKRFMDLKKPIILNPLTDSIEVDIVNIDFSTMGFKDGGFYNNSKNIKKPKPSTTLTACKSHYNLALVKTVATVFIILCIFIALLVMIFYIFNYEEEGSFDDEYYPRTVLLIQVIKNIGGIL